MEHREQRTVEALRSEAGEVASEPQIERRFRSLDSAAVCHRVTKRHEVFASVECVLLHEFGWYRADSVPAI